MELKRGKLIVIEGPEGSGKGLVADNLKEIYKNREDIIFTHEPGGTEIAEKIRKLILDPANEKMTPLTEFLMFYASRAEHVGELVLPALASGKHVICERADPSTIAYQIYARERKNYLSVVHYLSSLVWGVPVSELVCGKKIFDAVIYLDVAPEVGLARKNKQMAEKGIDRIEKMGLEFHSRVREGYLEMYKEKLFGPWYLIDSHRGEDVVKKDVLNIVQYVIGEN